MNWLLLIHQIPAKPTYFRAKIWRRLQQVGAVPIKQAVYVMPHSGPSREDLSWIAKEIIESGGEAVLLEAGFLEGLTDDQVQSLFQKARLVDYEKVLLEAQAVLDEWHDSGENQVCLIDCKGNLKKLRKTFASCSKIDFFPGAEQAKVEAFLADMETLFQKSVVGREQPVSEKNLFVGRTWVTKTNIYVDRMASGWFIKRFIDAQAEFKFVKDSQYQPQENEIRFDMIEAEYTHQGDLCTFEVLVQTFACEISALKQLAKVIHDIDLKDDAFGLPETAGIHALFDAITVIEEDDRRRIDRISDVLDGLLVFFAGR